MVFNGVGKRLVEAAKQAAAMASVGAEKALEVGKDIAEDGVAMAKQVGESAVETAKETAETAQAAVGGAIKAVREKRDGDRE
jgi:hypothetical protein